MSDLASKRERLRRWGWVRVALGLPAPLAFLYFVRDVGAVEPSLVVATCVLAASVVFGVRMIAIGHWASDEALTSRESLASVRLRLGVLVAMIALVLGATMVGPACGCSLRTTAYHTTMESDLNDVAALQEIYFAEHGTYSADLAEIGFVASDGVHLEIQAGPQNWAGKTTHDAPSITANCVSFHGQGLVVPTSGGGLTPSVPGQIVCDRGR